jgi:hypothetical protein
MAGSLGRYMRQCWASRIMANVDTRPFLRAAVHSLPEDRASASESSWRTDFRLASGPINVLKIDRYKARVNADSYAWFVTELAVETGKVIPIIYLSPRTSIKCVE